MTYKKILAATILATGCMVLGTTTFAEDATEAIVETEAETNAVHEEPTYDPLDYVDPGDYKGLAIEVQEKREVTEEDVDEQIDYEIRLYEAYEPTDKTKVEDGDLVNMDFVGKVDGEEFDGGTAEGYRLEIGSGDFVEGFEDQLVGHEVGDEFDVTVTFPEDYDEELAGKEAVFSVKLNSIDVQSKPEDAVSVISNGEYDDIEEYRKSVRKTLEETAQNEWNAEASEAALEKLKEIADVKGYPEDVVEHNVQDSVDYYKDYAESLDQTYDEFIEESFGLTEDELLENLRADAKEYLLSEMIAGAIVEKENIELTDEEFDEACADYAEQMWYDSVEDFKNDYGEDYLRGVALRDKALKFVVDNASITEVERAEEETFGMEELDFGDLAFEDETEVDETEVKEDVETIVVDTESEPGVWEAPEEK